MANKQLYLPIIFLGLLSGSTAPLWATPPSVSFSSLTSGTTIAALLNVPATVSPGTSPVARVVFSVDGNDVSTVTSSPYNFHWDTTSLSNGPHTLLAVASDSLGATGQASVNVIVENLFIPWTMTPGKTVLAINVLVSAIGGRVDWSKSGNNLIAFDKVSPTGYYQVYTMNPDGSNQTCVTCSNGTLIKNNGNPAWHPSGQYLVFQGQDPTKGDVGGLVNPGAGVNNHIWVINNDGTNGRNLSLVSGVPTAIGAIHPHFSTAGAQIIWAQELNLGGADGNWAIIVADFNGALNPPISNIQVLQPGGSNLFYETHGFSPDDSKILYTANPDSTTLNGNDLYTYDLHSATVLNVTNTASVYDEHGHFSPDGKKIDWISHMGLGATPTLASELWTMNPDGTNQTKLTYFNDPTAPEYIPGGAVAADSDWSPDSQKIVLLVNKNNTFNPQGGQAAAIVMVTISSSPAPPPPPTTPTTVNDLNGIIVYPNPWRSDRNSGSAITFDHLTGGTVVKIFDLAGQWIKTLNASAAGVPWDRTNDSGSFVASGLYIYRASDPQGHKARGKITIIK